MYIFLQKLIGIIVSHYLDQGFAQIMLKYLIRHHESEYLMCHKALMSCHENVINSSNRNDSVILSIQPYRRLNTFAA